VTRYAFTHPPVLFLQTMPPFHVPVAGFTQDLTVDMPLVIKQDVLGQLVDFHPGRRRPGVEIFMLLPDPGVFGNDVFMAVKAFFHGRQPGVIGYLHIGVAESALDLLDTAMHSMAEGDGLFRTDAGCR
jgi:hypothetical protein